MRALLALCIEIFLLLTTRYSRRLTYMLINGELWTKAARINSAMNCSYLTSKFPFASKFLDHRFLTWIKGPLVRMPIKESKL